MVGEMRIVKRDGRWWIGVDERDDRPIYRVSHTDRPLVHEDMRALIEWGHLSRDIEVDETCPVCADALLSLEAVTA